MLRATITIVSALLGLVPSFVSGAEFATSAPLVDKGAATFYVSADFGGYASADFMVDTGSGYVTINEKTLAVLREHGQAQFVKQTAGIMADGSIKHVPLYRIATVQVGGCAIRDVEAVVFPGDTRQILGLSALKKVAPFAVSVEPPQLMLSHCEGVPMPTRTIAESLATLP